MENQIYKGAAANDKTGTTARIAADIINGNFIILDDKITALQYPDGVLKSGAVVISGLSGAVAEAAFSWRLSGISYLSPAAFNFTLDAAAESNYRVDALLGNNTGSYNIFKGTESTTVAIPPTEFPTGTVLLGYVHLFGAATTDTFDQNQLANEAYIAKNELSSRKLFGTGNRASFSINSEAATFRIMEAISIASVSVAENLKKYIYSGKDHYIRNETGTNLLVKHNVGTGNYKYFFPSGTDFILKNNEIIQFKFRFTADNAGFLDYVGVSGGINLPKLQFIANGTDASFNLGTTALVKAIFWNGALLDDADWSQATNILSLTFTPANGDIIKPI